MIAASLPICIPAPSSENIFQAYDNFFQNKKSKVYCLFLLLFGLGLNQLAFSQDYTHALGIRVGSTSGISYKKFVGNSAALEGLLVYHQDGFRTIGLFEQHFFPGSRSNTSIFLGVGGYAGYTALLDEYPGQNKVAGVNAILGFEYVFPRSNVSFTFDLNPSYELVQNSGFSGNQAAVSFRYILD